MCRATVSNMHGRYSQRGAKVVCEYPLGIFRLEHFYGHSISVFRKSNTVGSAHVVYWGHGRIPGTAGLSAGTSSYRRMDCVLACSKSHVQTMPVVIGFACSCILRASA